MARFLLRGVTLRVPDRMLGERLAHALSAGHYEGGEADAITRLLRPGDRFADLGAGLGYICALAARIVGPANVTGVEASAATLALARSNLDLNGATGAHLIHGAVVPSGFAAPDVEFVERAVFWASALAREADRTGPQAARIARVPALPVDRLLQDIAPTVICCDIEGAETEVLATGLPETLRALIVEVHPGTAEEGALERLRAALAMQGFRLTAEGKSGKAWTLERG
jgi:FkbM family methyltransferase